MSDFIKNKTFGFFLMTATAALSLISISYYSIWAGGHDGINPVILTALIVGFLLIIVLLLVRDNDYLLIAVTACFSVGAFQLLHDTVGSFVDAFQGIVMFGDATQVATILNILYLILGCVLITVVAGFTGRVKNL